ncbi:MAG TPA: hypothetical protein VF807_15970 [Ktedonobacterales bacterium]
MKPAAVASSHRAAQALALARRVIRSPWLIAALLALVGVGAFSVGRASAPTGFEGQLPPHVGVPAHATLVRREAYLQESAENWYYAVAGSSHAALTAFYRVQLSQDGWTCFRSQVSTDITRDGKAFSGSSVYMTALRGNTRAQISTADQGYGAFLLQDDLPENSIALKISLEATTAPVCV